MAATAVIVNEFGEIGLDHLLVERSSEDVVLSAFGLNGEYQRAAAELAEARRLVGDDRYSSISQFRGFGFGSGYWGCRKSATCSNAPILSACARRECRRSEALAYSLLFVAQSPLRSRRAGCEPIGAPRAAVRS